MSPSMKRTLLVTVIVSTCIEVFVLSYQVCFIGSVYDARTGNQRRWFLPNEDPCECTAIRLGGMTVGDPSCQQVAPYYLKGFILSEDPEEIRDFLDCPGSSSTTAQGCLEPLGLRDGTIPDERITASTTQGSFAASHGRLGYDGFWRPTNHDSSAWIEVDLVRDTQVYGVITQGSNESYFRVTQYRVAYQQSSAPYSQLYAKNDKGSIEFIGNEEDAEAEITNFFEERVLATRVRIEPTKWSNKIALRFELLGCPL